MASFAYFSDLGLNLHHALYATAFASPESAGSAQPLPAELAVADRPEFVRAVEFYQQRFPGRDLPFDQELVELKTFLVFGHGTPPAGWQDVFDPVRPLYAETDWPAQDELNRAWSAQVADRLDRLPEILDELQRRYRCTLPAAEVLRVDTVWVGHRVPAYTTLEPTHLTCSTTNPDSQGWTAVEILLHEASHALANPLRLAIRDRVDTSDRGLGQLWHVVLFHLTGETVRRALAGIGVDYRTYADSTGLFDRAWPQWRGPITQAWAGYLDGTEDWVEACDRLVAGIPER
ncbi:hypothetical protein [Microlunatus sp. GCM10028923]|uniref:hypothetical protein n=1 Tax=Microlunatus sp. GCM10028923 TaxID=3273400 RepID=UPI0036115ECB